MFHKTKDYRIHQDERIVNKRSKLAKFIGHFYPIEGKLRKHNMSCTCVWCDINHPYGIKKRQASFKEIEKLRIMKEQVNDANNL